MRQVTGPCCQAEAPFSYHPPREMFKTCQEREAELLKESLSVLVTALQGLLSVSHQVLSDSSRPQGPQHAGFPVPHRLQEFCPSCMSIESVTPPNHLNLSNQHY